MWDESGILVHKRVGERPSNHRVPSLPQPPANWRGVRITQVGAKFWPEVQKNWFNLNSKNGRTVWPRTPRVLLLQSGTWYLILSNGRFCKFRKDLCNLKGDILTKTFVSEGRHAVRAIDRWAHTNPDIELTAYLASVACARKSIPCWPVFREGIADALALDNGSSKARFHLFDVASLVDAQPGERVSGHPSLQLSTWIYSTWLSLICSINNGAAAPIPEKVCGRREHIEFDRLCTAAGMRESCGKNCRNKGWSSYQHVPCQFKVSYNVALPPRSNRKISSSSSSDVGTQLISTSHSTKPAQDSSGTGDFVGWRQFVLAATSVAVVAFWLSTDISKLLFGQYVSPPAEARHVAVENKQSAESNRFDALGFARFIASMHVVLGHLSRRGQAPAWYISGWGFSWVPWFIMLSGYVLSMGELASTTQRASVSAAAFVYARLRGIYPAYVVGLALSYLLTHGPLQEPGTLFAQALLMQAWVPEWVEHCLQLHTWFLSAIMPCWAAHGALNATIKTLSTRALAVLLSACFAVGWAPAVLPRLFGAQADWYIAHSDKRLMHHMTHLDVAVAFLKFHPLAFAHLYVCGVTLAHLRARLWVRQPVDEKTAQHTQPPVLVRRGACIGYAVLLAVFTQPALRPPGHKLSARLGALAPAQALVLLGLSGSDDPLARLFATPMLRKLGDVSFCGYILQFVAFKLYGSKYADPGYWLFLIASAVVLDFVVVVPLRKEVAFRRFVGAAFITGAVMLLLYAGPLRPPPSPPQARIMRAPAVLNVAEGMRDARLELHVAGAQAAPSMEFIINPSLVWKGPRLFVAARGHRVDVRAADGVRLWNSSILFGELHPDNLTLVAPMKVLPVAALDRSPLSLAACAFSKNASALDVLVAGAEDPRLVLSPSGSLLVTFNHLLRTKPNATCADGDVVRRVYIAPVDELLVDTLLPALVVPPRSVVLSTQEKNWLVFTAASKLYAVYSIEPHVVVAITASGAAANPAALYSSSNAGLVKLAAQQRAVLHGGANAIATPTTLVHEMALPSTAHMLGAFHSLDARTGAYMNFVYLFDAEPPFAVTHRSSPLPLTEAPPQPGAETPRGAHMAFLSGIGASQDGSRLYFTYGSSNVESRVLTVSVAALATRLQAVG